MSEIAQHFELIEDDSEFGMAEGDVLACVPYDMDPEKLTVAFRVSDGFDPSCNVYRSQVRAVPGATAIRWRDDPPYGAEPDPTTPVPEPEPAGLTVDHVADGLRFFLDEADFVADGEEFVAQDAILQGGGQIRLDIEGGGKTYVVILRVESVSKA